MNVFTTLAVLLFCGLASARDGRLDDECLYGTADLNECCKGVPDAWYAHLRNIHDCAKFFQCEHEKPTPKDCAKGTHWNVVADRCEWPEDAKCVLPEPSTSEAPEPTTQTEEPTTQTEEPTTQTEEPTTQTEEPTTQTEEPTTQTEEPTTHEPTTEAQESTTEAQDPTTEATRPPPPPPIPEEDKCEPEPVCHQCLNGVFPADLCCRDVQTYHKLNLADGKNCSWYYQCVKGHAIHRECPEGLHWSANTDRCEWPVNAQCEANNGEGGNNGSGEGGNNGSGEGGNNGSGEGGNNGSGEGGNNGSGEGGNNGSGEGGNNGSGEGGNNGSGEGGDGVVSEGCIRGKISAEECCRKVPYWVDVLLQNNADCHTYIQCVHQKPVVRPCPANLFWSITRNRCEWIENATCTWE